MAADDEITAYGLTVRPRERMVSAHGHPIDLTTREFEILLRLLEHPGWVLSAEQLSAEAEDGDYSPESVSVLVSRLRHKLAEAGEPDIVETVRGIGYRLHATAGHDLESCAVGGAPDRGLRDACWALQEAVFEVEHSGSDAQRRAASEALDRTRRIIYSVLAE